MRLNVSLFGGSMTVTRKYWLHCNMCFSLLSYGVKVPGAAVLPWDTQSRASLSHKSSVTQAKSEI